MPIIGSEGAASSKGFGQFARASAPTYIEDVFSTWLYTGNGSTQTITNGIDLAGKGGLVWNQSRSNTYGGYIYDTARGTNRRIQPLSTSEQITLTQDVTAFNSNGFTMGSEIGINGGSGQTYVSWTFREQPKFFDVVTWTGDGANRTIAHNLGSVPGCIIVKRTDATGAWQVYHRSLANTQYMVLNSTAAVATGATRWNSTTPTSTVFSLGTDATVNASGGTYVAYVYAHDAGGFGLTGTDNVISCGSYTGNGSGTGPVVTLGYEPQWLMIKNSSGTGNWNIIDNLRGMTFGGTDAFLEANTADAEATADWVSPTATGFQITSTSSEVNTSSSTYIYIAIRRGPMKVPTTGTSVFGLNARTGTGANATVTGSAGVSDAVLIKNRGAAVASLFSSRLTGTGYLVTSTTAAEVAAGATILQANPWDVMDGVKVGTTSTITNASANTYINYLLDRAPGFFDVVCYTGTGANRTVAHNLAAVPELMIVKSRSVGGSWIVWNKDIAAINAGNSLQLNFSYPLSAIGVDNTYFNATSPSNYVFSLGTNSETNFANATFVAYLFVSCPGVSKVGSYTGTGTTQTINCGFTGGARFVMIKRTDSTGDWYVWDSARGIVAGNDPYLLLNSTAAEVTSTDYIDTASTGFEISSTAPAAINASGGSFIFLAIA
jgi:hypothetical protein